MKHLLSLLNHEYPLIIANTMLHMYLSKAMSKALFNHHLLIAHSHLPAITCERCLQTHEIHTDDLMNNLYYYFCNDEYGGLELVGESELKRWRFDLEKFLYLVIKQLKIRGNLQMLLPAVLWQLGTTGILGSDAPVVCLFCRKSLPRAIEYLRHDYSRENTAILYVGQPRRFKPRPPNLTYLRFDRLLPNDATRLHLDRSTFMHWLTRVFRRVFFDTHNGDLIVDGQPVSHALPASPQYFFLHCLWEQFDLPVSHEDIFVYCTRQLARRDGITEWGSEYLPSAFCHTMKRLLKQHSSHTEICDEVIQSTRTHDEQTAYRLTTPRLVRSPSLICPVVGDGQKFQ